MVQRKLLSTLVFASLASAGVLLDASAAAASPATFKCEVKVNGVVILTVQATDRNDCYRQTSFGSENCAHYAPYFKPGVNLLEQIFNSTDRVNSDYCQGPVPTPTNVYPLPEENLKDFKARMDAYFAPQIASRGLDALVKQEGGQYNEYVKFLRYWEPRLYPRGDFTVPFQLERNYYRRRRGPSLGAGLLSPGGANIWQELGPIAKPTSNVGAEGTGPIEFITFYHAAPSRMLCGSTAGGLFYSTNGGLTWSKTGTDTQIGRSGVGTAVFHPGDYKTWFTASAGNSGSNEPSWIGYTGGVFRTTDEGTTWSQIATQAQLGGIWAQIFKLAINPANANQVWAATSGGLFVTKNSLAPNPTWTSVPALAGKYLNDFNIRPGDANRLYTTAADWSGGNLVNWHYMYSSDNGGTWNNVPGEPASTSGAFRLTLAVTPAKADNLYCLTVSPGGFPSELYIFDFGSKQWNLVDGSADITMGGGHAFGVDPFNPNEIFLSEGTEGRRYTYQGSPPYITYNSTYSAGGTYHPDIEDLVPHPVNPKEVWMSHHGGVSVSTDNGVTWEDRSTGLGVAQVTAMATGASDPGYVAVGLYHDGTIVTTSPWYDLWSPGWEQFPNAFCDGRKPMIDPTTPQYMWHSCQWGEWNRSTDYGVSFSSNDPSSPSWIAEAAFNHLNPQVQYRLSTDANGDHTVMRTFDRGDTWIQIADFRSLYPAAQSDYILWRVYTPETNGNYLLVHLLERPAGGNWWTGNHLYRTKVVNGPAANVMASWEELPLPDNRWITDVGFDPDNPDVVYIANSSSSRNSTSLTGTNMVFKVDYTNPAAHTYNVCTSGICWDLTQNLPNALAGADNLGVERGSNGGLYFASDFGVWFSNNGTRALGGVGWTLLGSGLPNTGFNGLEINYVNNKVRVGSFGRGVWEADLHSGCTEPPSDLALWLPLDEATGPKALNTVVPRPGIYAGGPTPTAAGKVAGALCFDGQDDHVDVPPYGAISFSASNFSLDAWVLRRPGAAGVQVLVDKRTDATGLVLGYSLFLADGQIGLQLADGSYSNYLSQARVPDDGLWHHVAVTVDRGNPAGGLFYLDGRTAGTAFNPTAHHGSLNSPAPFRVGARSALVSSGAVSGVLQGCLDEVQAFRRVLSPDEVLAIYRAAENGQCKQSCGLPEVASFCHGANVVKVNAEICNDRSAPQTFDYSFHGLPVQSGCFLPGPASFTPASGTMTVSPGKCNTVQTSIGRPAAMIDNGITACYQMLIQVHATQETFRCGATVDVRKNCDAHPPS
ncbi:MAG: hypothetical protein JF614_18905 [Acidobacteria bacterium]|nr:hypothetical protein [Acidobacteriota bacterium]